MIGDENSDLTKGNTKHSFESMTIMVGEHARKNITRAKDLHRRVKDLEHHRVVVPKEDYFRHILKGLPSALHFVCKGFALRIVYT